MITVARFTPLLISLTVWLVLSVPLALLVALTIRVRDRQVPRPTGAEPVETQPAPVTPPALRAMPAEVLAAPEPVYDEAWLDLVLGRNVPYDPVPYDAVPTAAEHGDLRDPHP